MEQSIDTLELENIPSDSQGVEALLAISQSVPDPMNARAEALVARALEEAELELKQENLTDAVNTIDFEEESEIKVEELTDPKQRLAAYKKRFQSKDCIVSFKDLSHYDDILCDLLLDSMYLGFKTHKMGAKYDEYGPVLDISTGELLPADETSSTSLETFRDHVRPLVMDIIKQNVIINGNYEQAATELLELLTNAEIADSRFIKFFQSLSETQRWDFLEHCKRYLSIYHHSAGFEIAQTFRYAEFSSKTEAKLVSTKRWLPGDQIKLCNGFIANLTQKDEEELMHRDFSLMYSKRKKCMCLFLGPARFVNHDCDPNVKFIGISPNVVCFQVIKPIAPGDEILTYYAENYFGEANCDCLCVTCERKKALLSDNPSRVLSRTKTLVNYCLIPSKKDKPQEPQGPCCMQCGAPKNQREVSISEKQGGMCNRCYRHRLIFGRVWPSRKAKVPMLIPMDDEDYDEELIHYEPLVVNGEPVTDPKKLQPVFIDPEGKEPFGYWWMGMIVPPEEVNPKIMLDGYQPFDDDVIICFFNDKRYYSIETKDKLKVLDPSKEPFTAFEAQIPEFKTDDAVKNVLKWFKTGEFRHEWANFGESNPDFVAKKCTYCLEKKIRCKREGATCDNCRYYQKVCSFTIESFSQERSSRSGHKAPLPATEKPVNLKKRPRSLAPTDKPSKVKRRNSCPSEPRPLVPEDMSSFCLEGDEIGDFFKLLEKASKITSRCSSIYIPQEYNESLLTDTEKRPHLTNNNWAIFVPNESFMTSRVCQRILDDMTIQRRRTENWEKYYPNLMARKQVLKQIKSRSRREDSVEAVVVAEGYLGQQPKPESASNEIKLINLSKVSSPIVSIPTGKENKECPEKQRRDIQALVLSEIN